MPAAVAVSLLTGAWLMASRGWSGVGDFALMELRLQAMPDEMPLVGVYSRFGWWHPGPAFLLWHWVGYTLGGASAVALLMSMAGLHVAVLVCAWWLTRGVNLLAANALMFAGAASLLVRPIDQVVMPWNPYVGLAGVLLLVAAGWGLALRRPAAALVFLPWATFLVQSHVGYLPVVAIVALTAVGLLLIDGMWRRRRTPAPADQRRMPWWALLWGAAVALVMWLPPLVQQITNEPGNLAVLASQLGGESQGLPTGLGAVRQAFSVPMFLGPDATGQVSSNPEAAPVLLLLPLAALVVALVRRRREQIFAMVFVGAAVVAVLVSVAGLTPPAYEYLVPWIPSVAWLSLAWSAWVLLDPLLGQRGWWPTVIGVAAVGASLVVAGGLATSQPPQSPSGQAAEQLWSAVAVDAGGQDPQSRVANAPISVVGDPSDGPAQAVAVGMAALAVSAGADVAVPDYTAARLEQVVPVDGPGRSRYFVRSYLPGQPVPPGERVVITYDPFSAQEWARLTDLDTALADANLDARTRSALATQRAEIEQGRRAFEVLAPLG